MRVISDLEKKIIDRVCEGHTHISEILTDHIPDLLLSINKDTQKIELLLEKEKNEKHVELLRNATTQTEKIIYIINFLLYLEKEGYALNGYFSHGRVVDPTMGLPHLREKYILDSTSFLNWYFTDERMNKFIFTYSDLTIFPTNQLKAFQKNKYRTSEDIRHNQIITVTIIAIVVSLILGLLGILQNKTSSPTHFRHHCNCRTS